MIDAYDENDYIYAVARIRSAELGLLDQEAMKAVIDAPSAEEAMQVLSEKNYGSGENASYEEMFTAEREKLWALIDEIVKDRSILDVFRIPSDYNNLKAAIKESVLEKEYPGIYMEEATVEPKEIRTLVRERRYGELPERMQEIAREAHDLFLRTGDSQLCDIHVDRACMEAMLSAAEETENELLRGYAALFTGASDIRIAVRAALTGRDNAFLDTAMCECGILNIDALKTASRNGIEAICTFLSTTDFSDAVPELRKSVTAFECWCDNHIIEEIRGELYESFGIGPIAAYIIAKQTEMKSLRIILSGKENGFSEKMITERVRETYV